MGRSLAKKGGSAKKNGGHADWMDDEIDDANRLRSKDKIGFDASDSEEEDPDADLDTEAVMDIGGDSDDDSDADSDEEEEDEEEPNIEETRASPNSSMSSHADSDAGGNNAIDDDDDEKLEELPLQLKKVMQFYEATQQRMGIVIVGPSGCGKQRRSFIHHTGGSQPPKGDNESQGQHKCQNLASLAS